MGGKQKSADGNQEDAVALVSECLSTETQTSHCMLLSVNSEISLSYVQRSNTVLCIIYRAAFHQLL